MTRTLLVLSLAVVVLTAARGFAQDATDWQVQAGGRMSFDVVSVKLSKIPAVMVLALTQAKAGKLGPKLLLHSQGRPCPADPGLPMLLPARPRRPAILEERPLWRRSGSSWD